MAWVGGGTLHKLSIIFIGAALLSTIRTVTLRGPRQNFFTDFSEGLRELISRPWLCGVIVQFSFVIAGTSAFVALVQPLIYSESSDARLWSFALVAQSVGSVVGAGFAARVKSAHPVRTAVLFTFPLATPMLAVGFDAHWALFCVLMFISGVSLDVFGVLWVTTVQQQVPEHLLSRVFSYDFFGSMALAPLGLLVAGPLASSVGAASFAFGCAGMVVVATFGALAIPSVRGLTMTNDPHARTPLEPGASEAEPVTT